MLNSTRLEQPIPFSLFEERTFLPRTALLPLIKIAAAKKLLSYTETQWQLTALGRQFTNDLQALFLVEE